MSISLGGLASGMDTDAIIDQLVALEEQPIYNYQSEIDKIGNIKDAWRDVNSRLSNLGDKISDLKLSATFTSRTATTSDEDIVTATAANSAGESEYNITVRSIAKSQRLAGVKLSGSDTAFNDLTGASGSPFSFADGTTFKINGTDITVAGTDSLNDLMERINDSEAGVKASVVDNHLVLESSETGTANTMSFTDDNGFLEELGVINNDGSVSNEIQAASDAEVEINGITNITSSSNKFSEAVAGMTFEINPDAEIDSTAKISVTKDTAKTVKAVKAFVDQYNSIADFIDTKTDYDSDSKEAGILQGDATISRLQSHLRELVTNKIKDTGDYKTLMAVGIEIDRDGVMSLDQTEFEEALSENPEEVMKLFNADSEEDGYAGMATRIDSYVDDILKSNTGLIPRRLDSYDDRIEELNDSIDDVEARVEQIRERYQSQFASMETALADMQSQQSWMNSQLSNLNASSLVNSM